MSAQHHLELAGMNFHSGVEQFESASYTTSLATFRACEQPLAFADSDLGSFRREGLFDLQDQLAELASDVKLHMSMSSSRRDLQAASELYEKAINADSFGADAASEKVEDGAEIVESASGTALWQAYDQFRLVVHNSDLAKDTEHEAIATYV
jgi:hypothetical protein